MYPGIVVHSPTIFSLLKSGLLSNKDTLKMSRIGCMLYTHESVRSSSRKYPHLPSRIDSYMQSFFPRAIRLWNHLPDHLVETDNVVTFKSLLL